MHIQVIWKTDTQFNVEIASSEGKDAFLSIRGCRIARGKEGDFVSPPSTKNETSGKWWNHAWFSEKFANKVLELAIEAKPGKAPGKPRQDEDDDIPF